MAEYPLKNRMQLHNNGFPAKAEVSESASEGEVGCYCWRADSRRSAPPPKWWGVHSNITADHLGRAPSTCAFRPR